MAVGMNIAFEGAWTALVTPFGRDGSPDWAALERNVEFQIGQGIAGLVPAGTTGESPTLTWDEHNEVVERVVRLAGGRVPVLAGTGSNSTAEAVEGTKHAREAGASGALLVDCYYNCPSSLELREEYYAAVADAVPGFPLVPYVIPGRCATVLLPEDLAILKAAKPQVAAVKEATGDLIRMRRTRQLCGPDFAILSGDDDMTLKMILDEGIRASGVISVMSNIAPAAVAEMVRAARGGDAKKATGIVEKLDPLFKLVSVKTVSERKMPCGSAVTIEDKFRNPVGVKTMMAGLGTIGITLRRPLGKMPRVGVETVRTALRTVWERSPEILEPLAKFYRVDIQARLADDRGWESLAR
ncbi:MAG: 4-hydroxy-tetrahydrodipicolinate synthase [Planctomycetota bacterium]|nr:4-hydroxy-tetrahydrodipicolinate synthase [Planctomycetota bacterium]